MRLDGTRRDERRDPPAFPAGTVRALLETPLVTEPTKAVLRARLVDAEPTPPRAFDAAAFDTLVAACARLVAAPMPRAVRAARAIDDRLADGRGNGWRYAEMPPDAETYRLGLAALDRIAEARFGAPFARIEGSRQDEILAAVERDGTDGADGRLAAPARFFEELLTEVAELDYAHPDSLDEIGYVGFADAPGWQAIGLDRLEPREPRPVGGEGG